jgi:DNA processing protein
MTSDEVAPSIGPDSSQGSTGQARIWSTAATAGRTTADGPGNATGPIPLSSDGAGAFAAALACLPGAGPATLVAILQSWAPEEAWRRIRAGRLVRPRQTHEDAQQLEVQLDHPGLEATHWSQTGRQRAGVIDHRPTRAWEEVARHVDPPGWWAKFAARGVRVTWRGHPSYPAALVSDPQPAGVLFWRGDLRHLNQPCVAIVGTRRATPDGRSVAFEMGRDLAAAGICVVSGLALGIDGAAHAGALSFYQGGTGSTSRRATGDTGGPAPPAGVGASGVDVPYPRRQTRLWEQVAQIGVILSETPPGRPAQAWRFPARNRIIAALSQMVVVVESHQAGGSLITAEAAIYRGIDVRAVPGPVRSPASAGSNQLLHDGPAPVRNAQDVLDGLGVFLPGPDTRAKGASAAGGRVDRVPLDPEVGRVLDAVLWRPCSFNHILANSKVPVSAVARALDCLEAEGWVSRHGDWWVRHAGGERDKSEAMRGQSRAPGRLP